MRSILLATIAHALLLTGCGSVVPPLDRTPPNPVDDLRVTDPTGTSALLRWTAPGDDGAAGTATRYDIRISTQAAAGNEWNTASPLAGAPAPGHASASDSFVVTGLRPGETYYFALRAADEAANWAPWSNTASVQYDATPPAPILDLIASRTRDSVLTLTWTAPGDDGTSGRASHYDIRRAQGSRTGDEWNTADSVSTPPPPSSPGATESFDVGPLRPGRLFYFAIRTADEVPNWSAWSNVASGAAGNLPPETILSAGPPDSSGTPYRVHFFWSGADLDGTIARFDFILVTHPRSVANSQELRVVVPAPEDPRWTPTTSRDSLFSVLADTLRADRRGDIGIGIFDRWHTFFVRAVDQVGDPDLTPDYRSFDAYTLAPRIWLEAPVVPGHLAGVPASGVTIRWNGIDPIGGWNELQQPEESRWTILPARLDANDHPIGFPDTLYSLPEDSWQPWRRWAAPDSSGRRAIIRNLVPNQAYVFAVQGLDDAGAVTPKFDSDTPQANNYFTMRALASRNRVLSDKSAR